MKDRGSRVWMAVDDDAQPEKKAPSGPRPTDSSSGCAGGLSAVLVVGSLVVGGALLVGWKLLNTPDYASVGPGIGFFGFFICLAAAILGLVLGLLWLAYFRPNVGAIGKVAAVCLGYVAVIAILSWAPWIPPQTYFAPEIVGVVAAADYTPDGVLHVKLEDGRTLELQDRSQHDGQLSNVGKYAPLEGRIGISVGDLLLAGETPKPWYTGGNGPYTGETVDRSSWCYGLDTTGINRQETVDLESGLRLKKAAGYEPRTDKGGYGFRGRVCLNLQGEVTRIYGGD